MAKPSEKLSGPGRRLASPGKAQNRWDREQREVLHVLFSHFEISVPNKVKIFNQIFSDHLRACGLPSGLRQGPLEGQYRERNKSWPADICQPATSPEEIAKRQRICRQITQAAASLHLDVPNLSAASAPQPSLPAPLTTPAKRARSSSHIRAAVPHDNEYSTEQQSKRSKVIRRNAMVFIPQQEREVAMKSLTAAATSTPRQTPKSNRSKSSRSPDATIEYQLPSGTTIWLTPEKFRETQADLVPVSETAAHPHVPLLFRYWTDGIQFPSQSPLTNKGFTAGRFATTIIPPPPPPSLQSFPWSCAAVHLNRDNIASPFISTSNNLVWIIRLALKEAQRGASGGHISLIDPSVLDRRAIYHASPFHRELSKKKPFDKKAWLYHGMHEFLVWAKIPSEAIVQTFPLEMLFHLANRNQGVGAILRLEQLGADRTSYQKVILPAFKQQNITLSPGCIAAIAKVCQALGLNMTLVEAVSSTVADIIQGFGLKLQHKSPEEWANAATIFANVMCGNGSITTTFKQGGVRTNKQSIGW